MLLIDEVRWTFLTSTASDTTEESVVTLDYSSEVKRRWGRSGGQVVQKLRFICKGKDKCRAVTGDGKGFVLF